MEASPLYREKRSTNCRRRSAGWQVVDGHHLWKAYTFPDFRTALDFVNKTGAIAEAEGHHPDLFLSWGKVEVKIWTHKINGLTESDFILAAKIDQISSVNHQGEIHRC